jgi:aspartate racemase
MKTIGFIGGMSWESSVVYYEIANRMVRDRLGKFHSCRNVTFTVDFDEIYRLQHEDRWNELEAIMADAAKRVERAGADIVVLCTNTMHLCEDAIRKSISIPFLHIAEATGQAIVEKGIVKVALLGTKFTMEKDFYKKTLLEKFGIETIIPNQQERDIVHSVLYNELVQGIIKDESREKYVAIIKRLQAEGAQGVILGCTEIPLLISDKNVEIPVFDTTTIHAEKAVEWALR